MKKPDMQYIPKWLIAVGIIAGIGLIVAAIFVGSQLVKNHRATLVEIPQDRITEVSPVAKKYGTPTASSKNSKNLTVLFYYDGYKDSAKALRQIGLLQGALKNTQPFASSDVISTRVFTSANDRCHVERKAQKILVCDKGLIPEINKLNIEHFKLVILSPLDFVPNAKVVRGKNAALYLPSFKGALTDEEVNVFLSRFFLHELGHTFGLRDEYAFTRTPNSSTPEAYSDNVAYQPARPNCAPDKATAEKWWGSYTSSDKKVGYNQGCAGDKRFYFPQTETVMSDNPQQAEYGVVSEDYLRGVLDCFYGAKVTISYLPETANSTHRVQKCDDFKALYPSFWTE